MKYILRTIIILGCTILMTACSSLIKEPIQIGPTESISPTTQISDTAPKTSDTSAPTAIPEQTASPDAEWKTIYKEFLLEYSKPEGDSVLFGMALMDINADDIPELVLSSSSYKRTNYIYTISEGKVVQLGGFITDYQDKVSSVLDAKLYKNKETNHIQWIAKTGVSDGDDDGIRITFIDMNPVWQETPSLFVYTNTTKNEKHWSVNNAEVSAAIYNEKYVDAFGVLIAMPYTARQYEWDPATEAAEREPVIERMLNEYKPFSLSEKRADAGLKYVSYHPESSNISLQMDFDLDGISDGLTLSREAGAPKLTLDMNQNGIIDFELTEYEYGSFKKVMSGDLTGDGFPEILILADMGGSGSAGGSCALYGFSRMDGEWHAMEFPFLESDAIKADYNFEGHFVGSDVISVSCKPTNQGLDTINNDQIKFESNYLEQTYYSRGLTEVEFEASMDSIAYDLLLLQEMRNEDGSEMIGNGITKYTFIGGHELVSQWFRFKTPYDGR